MAVKWVFGAVTGLFDAVIRPSRFVAGHTTGNGGSRLRVLRNLLHLTVVYVTNLALYALPLTLTGFGVNESSMAPDWFAKSAASGLGNPSELWRFLYGFVQNSAFLFVATVLTLLTFHTGVLLSRNSKGLMQTVHTVVYSTAAYLAGIFTVVWALSTSEGVTAARELVVTIQKKFVYYFIDLLGSDLGLPGGRPDPTPVTDLSADGTSLIVVLIVMGLYYLYSLYLGARINHHTSRFAGLVVVTFVALSPALYVIGLILVYGGLPA